MAEDFKIKIMSDDFKTATGAGDSGGSGGGAGAVGLGAKLGLGIGIATEALGILSDAVSSIFRPVKSLLKGIFKLIGELLRPIAEIMIIVLKPIMQLLKPLISLFKTFMKPFMDIARQMSAISSEQMQAGDTAGAMSTAMEAFKTLIGPFIVSATSIALQLANSMLVTNLTKLLGTVTTLLLKPLELLVGIFSNSAAEKVANLSTLIRTRIDETGNFLINTGNERLTQFTQDILGNLQTNSEEKLAELKEMYGEDLNIIHREIPEGALEEQQKITQSGMNLINKDTQVGMSSMDLQVQKGMNSTNNSLSEGLNSINDTFKDFVDNLKSIADDLGDGGGGSSERQEKKWGLKGFEVPLGPFGPRLQFGK